MIANFKEMKFSVGGLQSSDTTEVTNRFNIYDISLPHDDFMVIIHIFPAIAIS